MTKILTNTQKANYYREIIERPAFVNELSLYEKETMLQYATEQKASREQFIYRCMEGNPGTDFEYWANKEYQYKESVKVVNILTKELKECNKPPQLEEMKKTKYENEFFSITEKFCFEISDKGKFSYDTFNYQLFNNMDAFKAEIIENITALPRVDRDFYLDRITNRLNQINEGFFTTNEAGEIEPVGIRATIEGNKLPIKKFQVEPAEVQEYFKMITKYKKEMFDFVNSLRLQQTELEITEQIENRTKGLRINLSKYGFFELPMVNELSDAGKEKLLEIISSNVLPYCIAMFDYLGFIKHLDKEHFQTKYKRNIALSEWFGSDKDGRAVKGYINSLINNPKTGRYKAYLHKEQVQSDYHRLK